MHMHVYTWVCGCACAGVYAQKAKNRYGKFHNKVQKTPSVRRAKSAKKLDIKQIQLNDNQLLQFCVQLLSYVIYKMHISCLGEILSLQCHLAKALTISKNIPMHAHTHTHRFIERVEP